MMMKERRHPLCGEATGKFMKAAVLSAGLALLPSCAAAQAPLGPAAPDSFPASAGAYGAPADPKSACVAVPERRAAEDGDGGTKYVTEVKAVEAGDYAMDGGPGARVLKVVKVDNESVGLAFLESRNSVWLLQYGQDSPVGGPAAGITAKAELCSGNVAKLTITYPASPAR